MPDHGSLTKEIFLRMAEAAGLDVSDESHMEELYTFLQAVLPGLKAVDELDLTGAEPAVTFTLTKE